MHVPTLIEKKREGDELTAEEIAYLVSGFTRDEIADYQMSAWAMAVFFQGMTPAETQHLTRAMMESGRVLDYPAGTPPQAYPQQAYPQQGYPQQGYPSPMGGGMMGGGLGGGSFLGTAAATVAGVVGGAMLLNGIRSMMGGHQGFGDYSPMSPSHAASPWDSSAPGGDRGSGDLARDAGLDDIGGANRAAASDDSGRAGFFGGAPDNPPDDQPTDDYDNAGDFGGGDSDSA